MIIAAASRGTYYSVSQSPLYSGRQTPFRLFFAMRGRRTHIGFSEEEMMRNGVRSKTEFGNEENIHYEE